MDYNQSSRNELYKEFIASHQPEEKFCLRYGEESISLYRAFTVMDHLLSKQEKNILEKMSENFEKSGETPGNFFKKRYADLVELCAGGKEDAEHMYPYFDKLNQFPYTTGWERRMVRTKKYINVIDKIKQILFSAYHFQLYGCGLSKFLLNDMSEELMDYKKYDPRKAPGIDHIVAIHLDAGNKDVKDAMIAAFTSENNVAVITISMIRGILQSNDKDLHELLGRFLVAARLQEGIRQAVCENMDCGTMESFRIMFRVIDDNDLLRFSAVRRAVATWIGILDTDHLKRSSDKTFRLMADVVQEKAKAYELIRSDDAVSILVGLWGIGIYEVQDALQVMEEILEKGIDQQKRVAVFYNHCLGDKSIQQKFANRVIESAEFDVELAAGVFDSYMDNCRNVASAVCSNRLKAEESSSVDLKLWFEDEKEAEKHLHILMSLFEKMEKKKYEFQPYIFPWYQKTITKSNVLIRICTIANGLHDEKLMDSLSDYIPEMDSTDYSRGAAVLLLLSKPNSSKKRKMLIRMLGDKETTTRNEALRIAKKQDFTQEEYDEICRLLRFKSAEIRLNIIEFIKKQDAKGLARSLQLLLSDKKEEMRLGGLDILRSLIKEKKEGSTADGMREVIQAAKNLAQMIPNPSKKEQICIEEIFEEEKKNRETDGQRVLYTEQDKLKMPALFCNKAEYPMFKISKERLHELYTKLDNLIYENRNLEVKTAYGETVLLGNEHYLPTLKKTGSEEENYPLMSVWKDFYENEIGNPQDLMALKMASISCQLKISTKKASDSEEEYGEYIDTLVTDIFGEAVRNFDPAEYRYGRVRHPAAFSEKVGSNLIYDILKLLADIYCDKEYRRILGRKTAEYLCCYVPVEKRKARVWQNMSWTSQEFIVSPLNVVLISETIAELSECFTGLEEFRNRFELLYSIEEFFLKRNTNVHHWEPSQKHRLMLHPMDYIFAAYHGIIREAQMYYHIFETDRFRSNLNNLFLIYEAEKYPNLKPELARYGVFSNEKLDKYARMVANTVADRIVKVECRRGDSPTLYSGAVTAIKCFYGTNHFAELLMAMGNDPFVRMDESGWNSDGSRRYNLSHLISVCYPSPEENIETFRQILNQTDISEKRLIEVAMYAPQWIDLIEEYLGFRGLKSGAYYFMAHMNDQYNRDERKFAMIARFTPLEKEELFNGAFDINWFEEAYNLLGEKRFQMLYDAAKYICNGSRHTRARKYADAALGRVSLKEMEEEIMAKRNKDLLMSYPLLPFVDKEDLLHKYEFIQHFRKESSQFGAQRRNSEGLACDVALRNLSTRAGFKDVTRLTLVMEQALAESMNQYLEWFNIEYGKDSIDACIQISPEGKPEIKVRKGDKILASVPATLKKHAYILELKDANKRFREQYSRTIKMFELSMEEREAYTVEEIISLKTNPIVRLLVETLVFVQEKTGACGRIVSEEGFDFVNEHGESISIGLKDTIRVAHPYDMYRFGCLRSWQDHFFKLQQEQGVRQPFRQVFRELYIKLDEELDQKYSRMFAGYQIQPGKTIGALKGRRWIADAENGLTKVFYKDNIMVTMQALADWFSPSDIEPPTLEFVTFFNRKTFEELSISEIPEIVYSEAMRDVDLAVSVAHAGGVDPEASHSTIEMRKVIAECNIELFALNNVVVKGSHIFISGTLGEYTVHLGSGVVHMQGVHQLHVMPVHSQHRGRIFLPFLDEDPKTAEIITKMILFANDKKIKDPYILEQMR